MQVASKRNQWWAWGFAVINWVAVVLSFDAFPLSRRLGSHDSSMFMYFGHAMNHGMTPYLDMFDHKGIVLFWLEQFADLIGFGHQMTGVWVLEAVFYAAFLIMLWQLLMELTKRAVVTGLTILMLTPLTMLCIQGGNLTEQLSLPFITLALYLFAKLLHRDASTRETLGLVLIGVTGGLVFFIRANMIAPWVVGCLALAAQSMMQRDWRELGRRFLWVFVGGAGVVAIVVIYGLLAGNLRPMFEQTFTLNLAYSRQISPADRAVAIKYFIHQGLTFGLPLIGLLFIAAGWLSGASWWVILTVLAYGGLNMLTVILSGRPYPHYFVTMIPVLAIMVALGLAWSVTLMRERPSTAVAMLGTLVAVGTVVSITPRLTLSQATRSVRQGLYRLPIDQKTSSAQMQTARYIKQHSTTTSKIYVHRVDAFIYLASDRWANSRYFTLPSLDYAKHPQITKDFEQRLVRNAPQFIVTHRGFTTNPQTGMNQFLKQRIQTRYRLVKTFKDPFIALTLYQKQ
ncbi:ArnT family glycosyltransferase [Lacticaseibacillus nasuensis]|uniref:Uncharacterized protein n=1 Tax=Lacticaseibacillus nasuensis JCM 17158 TaxID=1291734 RepID=A0A0R1JVM6_9LACO|nr:glycosyltransferase family 39 protein [Lacticaseibacillus nasuensis]KRK71698.1 hypothetical protein FD02_GL001940 [Lacticaseibacillus nasuensis JCM 17158]